MSIPRAKGINTRYDPLMAVRDAARVSPVLRWPMLVSASQCWPVRTAVQPYELRRNNATRCNQARFDRAAVFFAPLHSVVRFRSHPSLHYLRLDLL